MSLPHTDVTIADKTFRLTKWDAFRAEWWALRVFQAVAAVDASVFTGSGDPDAPPLGMAELARRGIGALAKIDPAQARPLLDEMLDNVQVLMPDGKTRPFLRTDVANVLQLFELRRAIIENNISFFTDAEQ